MEDSDMIKHLFHLTLSACAAVILAAACQSLTLEEEITNPSQPEEPVVSERATIPYSITVHTETTRVSYEEGQYAFKTGDKLHVAGVERTDVDGYLTQNGDLWSGELTYDTSLGEPADNTKLSITLVHADNTDESTYASALVGGAREGSDLLRDAVELYSLFTNVDEVKLSDHAATLYQQAAFLDVTFTFNFDGSHEVEPGQALVDLEVDGVERLTQTQFYAIDERNEDFQVHFMAVVPGGKKTDEFILMVGDREVEFPTTTTLTCNKKYTVKRTVDYGPQLGDPFWSDGTYGRLNHADPNASIVGIIVYVNHHYTTDPEMARIENAITEAGAGFGHGLVMALKNVTVMEGDVAQTAFRWSGSEGVKKCTAGYITKPSQVMDSPYFSGLENTNNIIAALGSEYESAASRAKNYGAPVAAGTSSGWFLPSIGQWMYTISIDGFGNAEHASEWINGRGKNWLEEGNVNGDLVYVKRCDDERVNLLIKALNERLSKLASDFSSYSFDYDGFGDPTAAGNISDNYWTSTEREAGKAIRMNLGTVEQWDGVYYSTIKARGEDKTITHFNYSGVNYKMKVRPFLAF